MTALAGTDAGELDLVRETAARIAARCAADDHLACWRRLQESGLTALRADENGAVAGSVAMAAAVVEELARTVCRAPLLGHLVAAELARRAGLDVGDEPLTVVVDTGWQALAAEGVGVDASLAERALATADGTVSSVGLGAVVPGADPTRPVRPTLRSPEPLSSEPAGTVSDDDVSAVQAFARVLLTADLLGAAAGVFDEAVRYAQDRTQFGVPIGSFQAVQHLCAQAFVDLEAMRSTLLFAVRALDGGDPGLILRTSNVAKSFAGDAAVGVVERAVQVFGGIAITSEHRAHRHLRRVLVDRELFGRPDALNALLLDAVAPR